MNVFRTLSLLFIVILTSFACQYVTIHTGDEFGITINPGFGWQAEISDQSIGEPRDSASTSKTSTPTSTETEQPTITSTVTETYDMDVFLNDQPTVVYPTATPTRTYTPVPRIYYRPQYYCPQYYLGTPCP